jgi:hypothetical protein
MCYLFQYLFKSFSESHYYQVDTQIIMYKAEAHRKTLLAHPNPLMEPLTIPSRTRRLRRKWTFDDLKSDGVAELLLDTEIKPSTLA